MTKSIAVSILAALAALAFDSRLLANVVPPSGLAPGSQYQLIFVTDGSHEAVDTDIEVYNSFVTSEAAFGVPFGLPAATWQAVASTDSVNANDNAPSGALPVYNTAGQQVSGPGVGIYTGVLDNAVGYDQFGNVAVTAQDNNVWTGSDYQGFGISGATLGSGSGNSEIGRLAVDTTWLQFGTEAQFNPEVNFSRPLYALSGPITVPVPEPATIALLSAALFVFAGRRVLRWRSRG
jgi:hypothetical protein